MFFLFIPSLQNPVCVLHFQHCFIGTSHTPNVQSPRELAAPMLDGTHEDVVLAERSVWCRCAWIRERFSSKKFGCFTGPFIPPPFPQNTDPSREQRYGAPLPHSLF